MAEKKNVLIVYAHQEPKSFNGALKDVAVGTLKARGHNVTVSDLYEMGFDPTASRHQFKELKNPEHFNFQAELTHAAANNSLPDDTKEEMRKIMAADLIILQCPMYWLGLPAIMKGWLERCFIDSVAFDSVNLRWFDNGPFKNKKVILSMTTGGTESFFTDKGVFGDIDVHLFPIQYSLRFTGFQVLKPQMTFAPQDVTHEKRVEMLQNWQKRLENIWTEDPVAFVHVNNFDANKGFQMNVEYMESVKNDKYGPGVGHHMGKPMPSKHDGK